MEVLPVAALADDLPRSVWSSCDGALQAWATLRELSLPDYDPSARASAFDRVLWQTALDEALTESVSETPEELLRRLTPLRDQIGAIAQSCEALRAGQLASAGDLHTLRALAAGSSLGYLSESARALSTSTLSVEALRVALQMRPPAAAVQALPSELSTAVPTSELARTALDAAQEVLVRMAMDELLGGYCGQGGVVAPFLPHTCDAVATVLSHARFDTAVSELQAALKADALRLPEALLEQRGVHDEATVITLAVLATLRSLHEGTTPLAALRGLSQLHCPDAASAVCRSEALAALVSVGQTVAELEGAMAALGPVAELDEARLRTVAATLVLRGGEELASEEALARLQRMESQLEALRKLDAAAPEERPKVVIWYVATNLESRAPGLAGVLAQLASLYVPNGSLEPAQIFSAVTTFAQQQSAYLPRKVGLLVEALSVLQNARSAPDLLSALATSPWVSEQLAKQLRLGRPVSGQDPFMDAPERRPGEENKPREGIARYIGGVRVGYVYQHWAPQEIPDVAYSTVGLNLLRMELLLESEELAVLKYLQGYFRYELAPGGKAAQDKLVQLYQSEASGWQAIVADLAAKIPGLGGANADRGPVFGFRRRFFLASAQALKDYWYYSGGDVQLLAPGDTVSTTTIMTTLELGFRSTTLRNGVPKWSWETGGYYMNYRKPYTHSRFTSVDRAAIFESTFAGFGAYGVGRLFFPSTRQDAPGSIALTARLGRASILLDDIAAVDVLPGDAAMAMVEVEVSAHLPALWWGGFFLGGMVHATYRTFGDFFSSGEPDPARANDQTLNDDWIYGLSAQAGYLL